MPPLERARACIAGPSPGSGWIDHDPWKSGACARMRAHVSLTRVDGSIMSLTPGSPVHARACARMYR